MTTPQRPNGYDGLIVTVLTLIGIGLIALCMAGCNPADKQKRKYEKLCKEAEALVAKAVYMCPGILDAQVRTDTVVMYTEAKAGAMVRTYSQASVDSLASMCIDLLALQSARTAKADSALVLAQSQRITRYVCNVDTTTVDNDQVLIRAWVDKGEMGLFWVLHPQRLDTTIRTPTRNVNTTPSTPAEPSRVRSWAWLWSIPAFVLGLFFGSFMRGSYRHQ